MTGAEHLSLLYTVSHGLPRSGITSYSSDRCSAPVMLQTCSASLFVMYLVLFHLIKEPQGAIDGSTSRLFSAPEQTLELREFAEPILEDGAVLLETMASEVCGTDVHLFHGRLEGVPYPIIPGHVASGASCKCGEMCRMSRVSIYG